METCNWCNKPIRPNSQGQLIMVGEEDLCKEGFENSDLQQNRQ